jgi:hypothetical protein
MSKRLKFKCIYVLLGPNKSAYVGQTTDPVNRKSRYKTMTCVNQTEVYDSLVKHGYSEHEFKILLKLPDCATRENLDFYEIFFFELYQSNGYKMLNLKSPGWNGRPNELAIKRLSDSHKGHTPWNKGLKGKQAAWNKGLTKSDYGNR